VRNVRGAAQKKVQKRRFARIATAVGKSG